MKTPVLNTAIVVIVASMVLGMFATKSFREANEKAKQQSAEAQFQLQQKAAEANSQSHLQQKAAEAKRKSQLQQIVAAEWAKLHRLLEHEREIWEDRTADAVGLLTARLEVGYLTDSQASVLRIQIRTFRRLHETAIALMDEIEKDIQDLADPNRQASSELRVERLKLLNREWVKTATECNRQLKAAGL